MEDHEGQDEDGGNKAGKDSREKDGCHCEVRDCEGAGSFVDGLVIGVIVDASLMETLICI